MLLQLVEKALRRLMGQHFTIVRKSKEGVVRSGAFAEVDFCDHEIVDKKQHLIIEKGKYKIAPRTRATKSLDSNKTALAVIDNSQSSFDEFWSDEDMVTEYLGQARQQFYSDVLGVCEEYLRGRVIDVGCGPGFVLKVLSQRKAIEALYGVDFSRSSIKRCQEELSTGTFLMGDIFHLAYRSDVFDVVICMETLEHLEHATEAIAELFRVCRAGGHVIITIPNGARDEYVGHLNFWTEQEFRGLLAGRDVVKFQYFQKKMVMMFVVQRTEAEI